MTTLGQKFFRFIRARRGNALIAFSLVAPVLVLAVGGAIDYAQLAAKKEKLQMAADAAALGAAKELYLDGVNDQQVQSVAESIAGAILNKDGTGAVIKSLITGDNDDTVNVTIDQSADDAILASFGVMKADLHVDAVARIVGGGRLCVIGLEPDAAGAIWLDKDSKITAPTCSVYSNSTNPNGLKSQQNSELTAEFICSAGGALGGKANYSPEPILDCPPVEDPLASRPMPKIGACVAQDLVIDGSVLTTKSVTLVPGTYCGGLKITGDVTVHFDPGEYIIKAGAFDVSGGAAITGEYVGFYFRGLKAMFHFAQDSSIDLSAPKDGAMAGMLFWSGPKNTAKNLIESDDARNLLGTIYLPAAELEIIANNTIADKSAYTVIVAKKLTLDAGPNLVLNTNYSGTDIPVPNGVGPTGSGVFLSQ
ncbi:MAG: pilus assembly protein [Rhodobiaceae bacterium]|nr:pilus assembly protein [Rhodobiaceae bacterium]